jgi:hypothetical protein
MSQQPTGQAGWAVLHDEWIAIFCIDVRDLHAIKGGELT